MSKKPATAEHRLLVTGVLLAIFMLSMGLRLYDLDRDSLWYDEILTGTRARLDLSSVLALGRSGEGRGLQLPLTYIVSHFFVSLSGESDFIVRTQAMVFGSLSILLTYQIGKILWTRREGLMGGFLLAVNPYHVRYSQEARYYGLMVFLALLSLIYLLKASQGNKKGPWFGFVLCTSLSLYNHYFAFLLLPAEVIFAAWVIAENWLSYRRLSGRAPGVTPSQRLAVPIRQTLMLSLSLALIGASYVPWIPALRAEFGRQVGSEAVARPAAGVNLSLNLLRSVVATYSAAAGAALLLWLGLFLLGLVTCCRQPLVLSLLWMGTPFILLSIVRPEHSLSPNYVLFILPLFLLVISRGIASLASLVDRPLRGVKRRRGWPVAVIASLTVLMLAWLSVPPLRTYYVSGKRDWRGAAGYLKDNMLPTDIVLVDSVKPTRGGANEVKIALAYYLSSYGIPEAPILTVRRELWPNLQALQQWRGETWGVLSCGGALPSTQAVTATHFHNVAIIRLREPSGDVVRDTVSMLHVLPDLLPEPGAQFDVHLALAEIYLRTGRFEQARLELDKAIDVSPDVYGASRDVAKTHAELEQLSYPTDEDLQHPLWTSLGHLVALQGYSMPHTRMPPAGTLSMTLWWQGLANMDRDYTAFVHVVGPDDRIRSQQDSLLQRGDRPTSSWQVGEIVRQEYELQLPPDTPPGPYSIKTGIYYWETGERLPVWDENWQRVPDDTVLLGRVTVNE